MITEKEVSQAIQECLREPITGAKRSALADLIIINGYLFGDHPKEGEPATMVSYSQAPAPVDPADEVIVTSGGSEFLDAVDGRRPDRVWRLMDEFVEAVKILHPKMYNSFIDKICDL